MTKETWEAKHREKLAQHDAETRKTRPTDGKSFVSLQYRYVWNEGDTVNLNDMRETHDGFVAGVERGGLAEAARMLGGETFILISTGKSYAAESGA
jgi:hypothetical protein